ncbi:MAG: xylR 3 [Verrucomicrobiales bacterium]|nr:xylR 3 [Verrucomicrobiales bacterium]
MALADSLSSVIPNAHRTGYEASRLLDRLMHGKKLKSETHLIAPSGVATRQSTDVLAMEDVNVGRAIHFIRKHGCEGINVNDVMKAVPQSRRVLEKKFQKMIGRTPHEEILRVQLNRVKELLIETDLPSEQIAEKSGFRHSEYLGVVFKREIGMPPGK